MQVGEGVFSNILTSVTDIAKTGLQVWGSTEQAKAMQRGSPYFSAPGGVTAQSPYALPSGLALPSGVSPYPPQMLPMQQASLFGDIPMPLLIGGGMLLLVALVTMRK